MLNSRLPTNFQLNTFIFEASMASLQTLLQSLKQIAYKSARLEIFFRKISNFCLKKFAKAAIMMLYPTQGYLRIFSWISLFLKTGQPFKIDFSHWSKLLTSRAGREGWNGGSGGIRVIFGGIELIYQRHFIDCKIIYYLKKVKIHPFTLWSGHFSLASPVAGMATL